MTTTAGGHAKRKRGGRAESIAAVVACAAALLVFDAAFNLARGSALPAVYWLLVLVASLTLATLVGALAALLGGGPRLGLALWLGLEGLAWSGSTGWRRLLIVAAFSLLVWALSGLRSWRGVGPLPRALSVGGSFCLATLVWPRLSAALSIGSGERLGEELAAVGIFGVALLLLSLWSRMAPKRWPGAGWLAAAALLITAVGVHLAYLRARPEGGDPRPPVARTASAGQRPSIVLLILDTVRADGLSLYGAEWDTTPRLRRFVEDSDRAVVFRWAFAPSNWTIPSHASLFTGVLPSEHGAHEGAGGLRGSPFNAASLRAERTLAEALRARGYRTAFITANPTLLRVRGMERGFDVMRQPPPPRPSSLLAERLRRELAPSLLAGAVGETPKAERVGAELVGFLDRGREPAFVVANFMEPHTPYDPPWSEAGRLTGSRFLRGPDEALAADPAATVALARARYLEEIRALDRQLGALLEQLTAAGHLDDAWLIITSDHGEAFMEHGSTNHGGNVYNEQVRVPLIVQPPRHGPTLDPLAPVSLVDLATTLAAVAGVRRFGNGRDLTAAASGPSPVVVEFFGNRRLGVQRYSPDGEQPAAAVVIERLKLIRHAGGEELYDLAADPDEQFDRIADGMPELEALRSALPSLAFDEPVDETSEQPTYDELETLRALGYLD